MVRSLGTHTVSIYGFGAHSWNESREDWFPLWCNGSLPNCPSNIPTTQSPGSVQLTGFHTWDSCTKPMMMSIGPTSPCVYSSTAQIMEQTLARIQCLWMCPLCIDPKLTRADRGALMLNEALLKTIVRQNAQCSSALTPRVIWAVQHTSVTETCHNHSSLYAFESLLDLFDL